MAGKSLIKFRDKDGINLKYPNRTCKECQKYPCFNGMENCVCNMASYGCIHYKEPRLNL